MKIKRENGLGGIDIIVAVMALMILSTLIISLIYNNTLENVKLKKDTLAMIYITEIFENIAIEEYENVTEENISNFIPEAVIDNNYEVEVTITDQLDGVTDNKGILKKITVEFRYLVGNKNYTCSMERMKIKE